MKNRVNPTETGWQSESERDRIKDLNDAEWSNEFGSQLTRRILKGKVSSREPDFLSADITGTLDAPLISGSTRHRTRLTKGGPDYSPSSFATLNKRLNRRDLRLGIRSGEKGRLVPQTALKRRQTGGRGGSGIIGIFCPRKLFYPGRGITKS